MIIGKILYPAALLTTASCLFAQTVPKPLWVRSLSELSSQHSLPGSPVEAVVTQDYVSPAGFVIPMGSKVSGTVIKSTRKSNTSLRLAFSGVSIAGRAFPLTAHVQTVDNARERVEPGGTILGLDQLPKRPGKVEMILLAAAYVHPAILVSLETTKYIVREVKKPEVHYAAGTDIALSIDQLPERPSAATTAVIPELHTREFDGLPLRTNTRHGTPSDWVNIAFVGSRERLTNAFETAGWSVAVHLSLRSDAKTFLAVAAHHSYRAGPVSVLLVSNREPDLVFQKQTNTFAKRHHIRFWLTDRTRNGEPIWIAAATHDIGIEFSPSAKTFTHRVDTDVDAERTKVISDLRFAGRTAAVTYLARPSIPSKSINGTGDEIHTDGRLAVVELT